MSLIADTYHHKLTNQHHIQMLTLYSNTHLNYRRIIEKIFPGIVANIKTDHSQRYTIIKIYHLTA